MSEIEPTPLLSMNLGGYMLTDSDLSAEQEELRNITNDADYRFFRAIPGGKRVIQKHACIVGKQGCGKSELENFRLWMAYEKYGRENVNAIYCDDYRIFIENMNDLPVQYGIIDDATSNASSREIHKQTEILKIYNKSRHVYEKILKGKPGVLLTDWCWQRWIELDPGFRDGHLLIFKTNMTGRNDRFDIVDKLGHVYSDVLDMIWDKIETGHDEFMSMSVARIASKSPENGGVGIYVSKMVEHVLPEMITAEKYFGHEEANIGILDDLRKKPVWDRRVEAYELYTNEGKTQGEIAKILSKRYKKNIGQGVISDDIKAVKNRLKNAGGRR